VDEVTAVILAGGRARRMAGQDKGLLELQGRAMLTYVIDAIKPQVDDNIIISANRNLARYREYGYPVVEDIKSGYLGPLAGIASALRVCRTDRLVSVPCDSPFVAPVLVEWLNKALLDSDADISVARDKERMQPMFAMLRRRLLPGLVDYLDAGNRKAADWYGKQRNVCVDFSGWPDTFLNVNFPDDKLIAEQFIKTGRRPP